MNATVNFVVPDHLKQLNGEDATTYRDRLLLLWQGKQAELARVKDEEMELRKVCAGYIFPDAKEGTNRVELGRGWNIKMVREVDYSFSGASREQIAAVETEVANMGNEGQFLADRLFKWTCEPSKSEYKKLDMSNPTHKKIKAAIDKVLVTKDGAPKMTIEEPKTGK